MSNVSKKKSFNFVLLVSILGVGSLLVGLLSFYLLKLRKNSLEKEKEILETKNKLKLNSPSKTTSENSAKPEETASEDQKEPTEFSELPPPKTRSKLGVSFNPEDKIHYLDRVSENPFVTSREPSRYPESILKTSKIPKLKKRNDSRLSKSVFAPSSVETITEEPFLVLNPNGEDFPLQEDPSNFSMMKLENFEELKRDFKKHWEKLSSKSRKALDFFN